MPLETDLRTESDPQIIEGAIVEVDLIAHIHAEPEGSPEAFDTGSRIEGNVSAGAADAVDGIGEGVARGDRTAGAEVDEPDLVGDEHPEGPGASSLKLGTEQSGERTARVVTKVLLTLLSKRVVWLRSKS